MNANEQQTLFGPVSGDAKLMALSWKEPYATLMLHGKIETRTWATNYRGPVLLCASKTGYARKKLNEIAGEEQLQRLHALLWDMPMNHFDGCAFAIGRLVGCRPMVKADENKCFVQYREPWTEVRRCVKEFSGLTNVEKRLWLHVYQDVRPIEPFTWKGAQGWKTVSQEIIDNIKYL